MFLSSFLDYLALEKNYSVHTVRAYAKDVEDFSAFAKMEFDQQDVATISYGQIRSWIVSLVDKEVTNRSINRKVSSLKAYYNFLLKIEAIEVSPLSKHKALKVPKKVELPFSQEEVNLVLTDLKIADDFESWRDLAVVELLYGTGMRRAELIGLVIGDVDFEQKSLKVLGKRNKERIIPLLPSVEKAVRGYLAVRQEIKPNIAGGSLLITQKGVKLYDTLVYRIVNRYFSRTSNKLKKSPHIIRHSFATHLLNQGADLNVVKELLGHASLASTQVYTHNSMAALKDVYKKAHPRNKK